MFKAFAGIWTPAGEILTYDEHGVRGPITVQDIARHAHRRFARKGEALTRSTRSHRHVWVRWDVADVHNAVCNARLAGYSVELEQSGGMTPVGTTVGHTPSVAIWAGPRTGVVGIGLWDSDEERDDGVPARYEATIRPGNAGMWWRAHEERMAVP